MGLHGRAFQANIFIVDMVFLGDTRSAEELAVFTNMAPERLCLGCGLRVDENFFYLDAAWLNEGRCPGGRPSVSKN